MISKSSLPRRKGKEKRKRAGPFPPIEDVDKYVDDCFEFVADNQKDSDVVKVPKGKIMHANRVVNLRSLLQKAKQNVSKNVIATRAIENHLLEAEAEQQRTRDAVLGVDHGKGKSKDSVPLQCGKPLAFTDAHLKVIETGSRVGLGVGHLLQKSLNGYEDGRINKVLDSLPSDGGMEITIPLFKRIVTTCSGSYLSEADAVLLYDRSKRLLDYYLMTGRIVNYTCDVHWTLLCRMLKKRMLLAFLARGLLHGEAKLNLGLGFGQRTLTDGGVLGATSSQSMSPTFASSSSMVSRSGTADGLLNAVSGSGTRNIKRALPTSASNLDAIYGLSLGGKAKMVNKKRTGRSTAGMGTDTVGIGNIGLPVSLSLTQPDSTSRSMAMSRSMSGLPVIPHKTLPHSQSDNDLFGLTGEYVTSQHENDRIHADMAAQMAWVTQTISLSAGEYSAARTFSKHMGARKMEVVFLSKVFRTKMDAISRWKAFSRFSRGEEHTVNFLKVLGSYRIINAIQSSKDHKMNRALHKFKDCNQEFNDLEKYAAVVEIQRVGRGMLARTLSNRLRRHNAATSIARIARGRIARRRVRQLRYERKGYDAAKTIIKWWNNLKFQRLMRKIRASRRRERMAVRIQKLVRVHRARKRMAAIKQLRLRKLSAIKIQSMFRRFKMIIFVEYYRHNRLVWDAALLVSKRARIVLAKARVRLLRFHNGCAMMLQGAWLMHRARLTLHERRRLRAAKLIQRVGRGSIGRAKHRKALMLKNMFNQQKMDAIAVICPLLLGYRTRRIWGPRLKAYIFSRHRSSTTIQQLMDAFIRARIARRMVLNMREKRKVELARRKEATRLAFLKDKKAKLIQRNIRGVWGRSKALERQKQYRQQQAKITMAVPTYYRKRMEYFHEQMIYHRPYIMCLQRGWRCYAARVKVEYTRQHVNASRIQRRFRIYLGIRASRALLKEMKIQYAIRMEAAVPIQCLIRMFLAKCLAYKHFNGSIVVWYFREIRSTGLIGRALTNFRIRKRELDKQNTAMFVIHKYAKRWLTIRWFQRNYAQLVRDRAKRAKDRIRRDKAKLAAAATVIQCMVRVIVAKQVVNQQRVDIMLLEQEAMEGYEKSDFMGDLMKQLATGPISSKYVNFNNIYNIQMCIIYIFIYIVCRTISLTIIGMEPGLPLSVKQQWLKWNVFENSVKLHVFNV